jgi:hypothetical protein
MAQQIESSTQFTEKINSIKTQFFSVLDDFKKYYVYYHKNPEVTEFQNYYSSSKGQLQSLSKEIITTTNNINQSIQSLNNKMMNDDKQLNAEKKINNKLTKTVSNLENTQTGSAILIDDSKYNYNLQYSYNIELFIGILILGGALTNIFRTHQPTAISY